MALEEWVGSAETDEDGAAQEVIASLASGDHVKGLVVGHGETVVVGVR